MTRRITSSSVAAAVVEIFPVALVFAVHVDLDSNVTKRRINPSHNTPTMLICFYVGQGHGKVIYKICQTYLRYC